MSTRRHPLLWLGASLACAALVGACATGKADDDGGGGDGDNPGQPDGGFVPQADAAPQPDAMPTVTEVTLTHSASMTVQAENSAACTNGSGLTSEASYYRVFDLASAGITRPLTVTGVKVGVESAQSGSGSHPAAIKLHTLSGELRLANLTPIGSAEVTLADQELTILDVPVSATAPAGSTLVVEFWISDGFSAPAIVFPGSNGEGQTGPTYVRDTCPGGEEPTDVATFGFPDMHLVLAVEGSW